MRDSKGHWVVLAFTVGAVLVLYVLGKLTQPPQNPPSEVRSSIYTVYYLNKQTSALVAVPSSLTFSSFDQLASIVIDALKDDAAGTYIPPVPEEANLKSVKLENGTLVLDFSREFTDPQHWSGSGVAYNKLQALVLTLCQLPGVQQVKILVDGRTPESLGGHLDVSQPLKPDYSLTY